MFPEDNLVLMDSYSYVCKGDKIYRESDLPFLRLVSKESQMTWDTLAQEYMDANPRDGLGWGSCVLGEGFYVPFLPNGKRKPRDLFLAKSWGAAAVGSLPWEHYIEEMHEFFVNHGIKAYFTYGRMD